MISYALTGHPGTRVKRETETKDTHICRVNLTTQQNTVAKIRFVEQTCSHDNYIALQVDVRRRRMPSTFYLDTRTGCENWTSPLSVDYLSLTNHVTFSIVIGQWAIPYIVRLRVTAETSEQPMLQWYQLSPHLGIYLSIRLSISLSTY